MNSFNSFNLRNRIHNVFLDWLDFTIDILPAFVLIIGAGLIGHHFGSFWLSLGIYLVVYGVHSKLNDIKDELYYWNK